MTDEPTDPPAPDAADRRTFLRRLSGQAIEGAGRIGGMSQVVRRSVVAAGDAVSRELGAASDAGVDREVEPGVDPRPAASDASLGARLPAARAAKPARPVPAGPAQAAAPSPALTPAQEEHLLAARSATLAVNDPSGHPHVTSSWFHWDGEVVRLPTGFFTARATNIARDARVSVVVERADTGAWVAITGTAELVAGPAALDAARPLLEKYRPAEDPVAAWAALGGAGDQAVVVVRPLRFTWRLG